MAERKRLMTIWRQGANAPWTSLLRSVDGLGYAMHHYTVDGSAEEALLWVEGADTPRIFDEPGEVFTLTLARDVGARLTTPSPWLYIVHTDIPEEVVADYNAWYDEEHLPRLVGVPGVERARRFVADGQQSPRYLTAYDLSIKDAFESPEGLRARKTPWTERMRSLFRNTRRKMCAPRVTVAHPKRLIRTALKRPRISLSGARPGAPLTFGVFRYQILPPHGGFELP